MSSKAFAPWKIHIGFSGGDIKLINTMFWMSSRSMDKLGDGRTSHVNVGRIF
jgi:hypothetical protein